MSRQIFLGMLGISFGVLSSAGVFTVLIAVGLIPRFAGKTHTSRHVFLYEEMVVAGAIAGCIISIFGNRILLGDFLRRLIPSLTSVWEITGMGLLGIWGLFSGMFVGCLALAIAEMLDSIPIFARRISLRHGIGLAVLSMAAGKVAGSLVYFWTELYKVVE